MLIRIRRHDRTSEDDEKGGNLSKEINSNRIAAFASLVAAFAAIVAASIAWWQGYQSEKALQLSLAENRPILVLDIAGKKLPSELSRVQFTVKNTGPIPARLIDIATQPWVDGKTRKPTDHTDVDIVMPGETHIISSFDLTGELAKRVIKGDSDLRYAIAVLYKATTNNDTRRWITDAWIAFSPRKRAFAVRKRDEIKVGRSVRKCNLDILQPNDWMSWHPPPPALN